MARDQRVVVPAFYEVIAGHRDAKSHVFDVEFLVGILKESTLSTRYSVHLDHSTKPIEKAGSCPSF